MSLFIFVVIISVVLVIVANIITACWLIMPYALQMIDVKPLYLMIGTWQPGRCSLYNETTYNIFMALGRIMSIFISPYMAAQ